MKKLLLSIAIFSVPAILFAEPNLRNVSTALDDSPSAGKTITANVSYKTGYRVLVWSVYGVSDKATSKIQIQRGNAAGYTTSFTTITRLNCGSGQVSYVGNPLPVFVGDVGYSYRFLLDSTAANSIIINYSYE